MNSSECTLTTGLAVFQPDDLQPWNLERVRHLYSRLGIGAGIATLRDGLNRSPADLVDELLDEALLAPPIATPPWADWAIGDYEDFQTESQANLLEFALGYIDEMLENPVRARLILFWHNHFVTRYDQYVCPSWLFRYYKVIEQNLFGNFKTFVKEMGTTPAMLVFLNGVQNTRFSPNENYARELYELFTLGRDQGYTQEDIEETARALTGWNGFSTLCAPINFAPALHDQRPKTIFGKTDTYNYDTLHNLLFEERSELIAKHICQKIYVEFVSPEVDELFVDELANVLLASDFELEPVYRVLFKSERFFDQEVLNGMVKGPLEYFVSFIKEVGFPVNPAVKTLILFQSSQLGQQLFSPPTVAGWPGDKQWITSSLITQRWLVLESLVFRLFENLPDVLLQLVSQVSSSEDDPEIITRELADFFMPKGLESDFYYDQLIETFKWEVPENYFEDGSWNIYWETLPAQTGLLLQQIIRSPEFQLK